MDGISGVTIYGITWTRTRAGEPKLKLFVTDQEGFKSQPIFLDLPVPPFFYAKKEIVEAKGIPPEARIELVNVVLGMEHREGQVYKIVVKEPSEVTGLRGFYGVQNTCEADVPYGRRVLVDRDLTVSMPSRRLYIDIECDGREGVPDEVEVSKRIISIAAVDQDGNEYFFSDADEVAMISQFLILLDKYPIACTWYGNKFDWPYLQNRCQKLDIRFYWDSVIHIDLLVVLRDVMQEKRDHFGLDFIADYEELPHRKSDVTIAELWPSFEGDKTRLRHRNVQDAHIIRDLDIKYTMSPIMFDIAKVTHTSVRDLLRVNEKNTKDWNPSIAVDGLNLTLSGRRTPPVIWPSKEFKEDSDSEKQYIGALVLDPIPGLHKNVVILDVKSLYPSIIRSLNVGPETYRPDGSGDIAAPIGSFVSEPESIMAEAIRSVTELRERYRREKNACAPETQEYKAAYAKEYAMKVVNNSIYGVSGSRHSRYFSKDIAENVTLTGRRVTSFMKEELENLGYKVIYGDTDSCMVVLPEDEPDVVGTAQFLVTYMTERGRQFLEETFHPKRALFSLDISAICQSMFIMRAIGKEKDEGVKKRYAGIVIWQKEPTFHLLKKGLEMVRHDSTKLQKEVQEDMLWRKLLGDSIEEQAASANEWKRKLLAGEVNDKVVTWKGFGKHIGERKVEVDADGEETVTWGEYKVLTPAMRAGMMMVESGAIARLKKGDKIAYVKTGPKPEQVKPVVEGEKLVLTEAELAFIWDSQLKRIFDRLEIPVESEKARYKPSRQRKAKKAKQQGHAHVCPEEPCTLPADHVCVTMCDETNHFRGRCERCGKGSTEQNPVGDCPDCERELCKECYGGDWHACSLPGEPFLD